MTVLITGIDGFIGQALAGRLIRDSIPVAGLTRQRNLTAGIGDIPVVRRYTHDLASESAWQELLNGVDTIVHLAGRAHVMRETTADPLSIYRQMNTQATTRLAEAAAAHGVRRLVFISTIKVNGEVTSGSPFRHDDPAQPVDPYAISKWEAEQALFQVSDRTGLEVAVVRPPLVYGPGVKGNFIRLLHWIERGWPLPFGACHNQRSLIGLSNLVDLLACCVQHPGAAGQTFLASDGTDLSTPELIRKLASAIGRTARLISVPEKWLRSTARVLGRPGFYNRVCGSLRVDMNHTQNQLGWMPPDSIDQELARVANWFRK